MAEASTLYFEFGFLVARVFEFVVSLAWAEGLFLAAVGVSEGVAALVVLEAGFLVAEAF